MQEFPGSDSKKRFVERDQYRRDLAEVLAHPAGFRFICRLLKSHGYGNFVSCDPAAIALYNEAEQLMRDATLADAGAAIRIMAAMRGIELQ